MYTDDTLLLNTGQTELEAMQLSQLCFDKIIAWRNLNRLTINQSKTNNLCITNHNNLSNIVYKKGYNMSGKCRHL